MSAEKPKRGEAVDVWSYFNDAWDEKPQVRKVVEVKDERDRRVRGVRVTVDDLDLVVIAEDSDIYFPRRLQGCALFWRSSCRAFWNHIPQALYSLGSDTPGEWVDRHPELKELFVHLETLD